MAADGHLSLRLIRLRAPEEWAAQGDGLCLLFPQRGTGRYVSRALAHNLSPGDVLVVNSALGGKVCASNQDELLFRCFSLCFEHLFPLFAAEEISHLQTVSTAFKDARFLPASSAVAGECHRLLGKVSSHFDLDHRIQLLRVFAAILWPEFKSQPVKREGFVRADEHMVQVFERLSSQDLLQLSVGELSDRFGCSRRHLNRLFHQHFGVAVASLRMEMRLVKAASLLRDPGAKVINVAEQCGFNHLGLFNTCFKRRFGTSPGQWRKTSELVRRPEGGVSGTDSACRMLANGLCPWSDISGSRLCASRGASPARSTSSANAWAGSQGSTPRALAGRQPAARKTSAEGQVGKPHSKLKPKA